MTRTVAFYLPRVNYLKVMAPIIAHLQTSTRFRPLILLPGWPLSKPALQPTVEHLQPLIDRGVDVETLPTADHFDALIHSGRIHAVANLTPEVADIQPELLTKLVAESHRRGILWIALPYTFAQDQFVLEHPERAADTWDVICTLGPRSMAYIDTELRRVSPALADRVKPRLAVTGYPELDGIDSLDDEATIRRRYELPPDKPIIVLASAPPFSLLVESAPPSLRGLDLRFRGQLGRSIGDVAAFASSLRYPLVRYRDYLAALRRFADENGAWLVAKTRAKHQDPPYLAEYAHAIIGDRSYFPFTALELMRVASLYVGFYSAMTIEAVAMGVYAISILFVPPELAEPQARWRRLSDHFYREPGGLWNTPGVSEVVDGAGQSSRDWVRNFSTARLGRYRTDAGRQTAMLDAFISYRGRSTERLVEILMDRWSGR